MKTLTTLCLSIVLATTLAFAAAPSQNPAGHVQHQVAFLTTLLNLTTGQQQQATTIFTNAAASESSIHSNMKSAHESLQTAIQKNDTAAIDQAATTIGSLTEQATAAQAKAQAAFYQILTQEQQTKFNQLESQGHGHFGGPMHGEYFGR